MEIIGLSGYARSGKDEAAKILVEEFGFTRVAFADKLREVLYELDPIIVADARHHGMVPEPDYDGPVYSRVQKVIDEYGWDGYKEGPFSQDIRRLLQRLGTEAGRKTLWDSIWIDAALTGFDDDARLVVTDCRFPNEAQAITERGGQVWRIIRPGVGPATGTDGSIHPSETSLDDWDFDEWLWNDDTLAMYRRRVMNKYQGE